MLNVLPQVVKLGGRALDVFFRRAVPAVAGKAIFSATLVGIHFLKLTSPHYVLIVVGLNLIREIGVAD